MKFLLDSSGPIISLNRTIATFFSAAGHPLLLPSYLYYVVCYQLPGVVEYSLRPQRWHLMGLVLLFTFILPTIGTALLLWSGLVKGSLELRERQQRPLPLLLATGSFGAAALLLTHAPQALDLLLPNMMVGMTLAVLLTLLISLRWKISAHGVGVGGAVGLFTLLYIPNGNPAILWWWLGSIVLAVVVLYARLALKAHTPAQAWAGFVLGLGLVLGFGAGLAIG